jgi:hypothetical protein
VCGYLVVGLTTPICPECGNDLTSVGVRMPGDARPMPWVVRALLFSLVYLAIAALVWPVLEPVLPRWYAVASSLEMGEPGSKSFQSVKVLASGGGWSERVNFDHVDLTITPNDRGTCTLGIDINSDASPDPISFSNADYQSIALRDVRDLTPELVFRWITMYARPDSPQLRDDAASISAETIKLASSTLLIDGQTPDHTPFSSLNFRQTAAVPILTSRAIAPVVLVGIIVWAIGVAVIYHRFARRLEVLHA